jgi:hypothetical protein
VIFVRKERSRAMLARHVLQDVQDERRFPMAGKSPRALNPALGGGAGVDPGQQVVSLSVASP